MVQKIVLFLAVISGLLTSTFLTLLIIPTAYYLLERAHQRFFEPPQSSNP